MNGTITNALPDIPRVFTAISEWAACIVYLLVIHRRVSIRRTMLTAAFGLALMIAIQYLDGIAPLFFWIFGMLLAFASMFAIIMAGSGISKRESLYITARAFVLAELVASLHWQIATFAGTDMKDYSIPGFNNALLLLVYLVCFTIAWAIERRNFSNTETFLPTLSATVGTIAITVATFAMSNLSFVSTNTPFSGTVGQEVFYIRTLVDLCGYTILYAQQEQLRALKASTELASIDQKLISEHQEYLQSRENVESLGRMAHDLKHQIMALRAEVDPNHAAAGFEQLQNSVSALSAQQHTGNPVLDVILTTKMKTCQRYSITLTAVADGKLLDSMSSMDIATLFGNGLDNAIEATAKLEDPQRRLIRLALYAHNDITVIRMENYYDSLLKKDESGNLRTTKTDEHSHGFGVKSIRHIAQQYGGSMSIKAENHWFTVTILLPRKP